MSFWTVLAYGLICWFLATILMLLAEKAIDDVLPYVRRIWRSRRIQTTVHKTFGTDSLPPKNRATARPTGAGKTPRKEETGGVS